MQRQVMHMHDRKGFSLIELIVVIAILAIVSVVSLRAFYSLGSWKVKKCVSAIDGGLDQAKVTALSKSDAVFRIYKKGTEYWMAIDVKDTEEENERIAKEPAVISYVTNEGTEADIQEGDSESLKLQYDRSSGAFKPIGSTAGGRDIYCSSIIVTSGNNTKTIVLYYATGKHQIQ